eukprot:TRINITY_DN1997_c0_g1_i16.p1 TRINITY_DN1997_c0_g1~~TRINITY_DN1997_c0_g1_i16.p1  ORF type:complete len:239 (+),score=103.74 TRINITY_DN1997_c0_g1_i16:76-717(+)
MLRSLVGSEMCIRDSFACSAEEVHLWLTNLPRSLLPTFLQLLNTMLQQSLSKVADRVAEAMTGAKYGILHQAAQGLITRYREKIVQKEEAGKKQVATTCTWQQDLNDHISAFEQFLVKIEKKWDGRNDSYATFRNIASPLELNPVGEGSAVEAAKLDSAGSSQLLYPVLCVDTCLLYTSDAADEEDSVDLGGRRIIKKKKKKRHGRTHAKSDN